MQKLYISAEERAEYLQHPNFARDLMIAGVILLGLAAWAVVMLATGGFQ